MALEGREGHRLWRHRVADTEVVVLSEIVGGQSSSGVELIRVTLALIMRWGWVFCGSKGFPRAGTLVRPIDDHVLRRYLT
jgi:hypothetical protein